MSICLRRWCRAWQLSDAMPWLCRGYAVAVPHIGLSGASDPAIWRYAYEKDLIVVTTNAKDFLPLLDVEVHPGLIVLRESGLSRQEQWVRIELVLRHLLEQDDRNFMLNKIIEIEGATRFSVREIPKLL